MPLGCWIWFWFPEHMEDFRLLLFLWAYLLINKPLLYCILGLLWNSFVHQQMSTQCQLSQRHCWALPRPAAVAFSHPTQLNYHRWHAVAYSLTCWAITVTRKFPKAALICVAWSRLLLPAVFCYTSCMASLASARLTLIRPSFDFGSRSSNPVPGAQACCPSSTPRMSGLSSGQ